MAIFTYLLSNMQTEESCLATHEFFCNATSGWETGGCRQRREYRDAEMVVSRTVSCGLSRSAVASGGPNNVYLLQVVRETFPKH